MKKQTQDIRNLYPLPILDKLLDYYVISMIKAIAQTGHEMQAKLLQSLGLQSILITDGKSPINLFNTAQGLINPASITNDSSNKN